MPINPLFREDGGLCIVFLSGNGVVHTKSTGDDWYLIDSVPVDLTVTAVNTTFLRPSHRFSEPASPLGCVNQYQFCNSGLQGTRSCGPLASFRDAIAGAGPFFDFEYSDLQNDITRSETAARFRYFVHRFYESDTSIRGVLGQLGPTSLLSQRGLASGIQGSLAPNQWQLDVTYWQSITMARMQVLMINAAYGPTNPIVRESQVKYTASEYTKLCGSQACNSTSDVDIY